MAKASEVIQSALLNLNVSAAESGIEAAEAQGAIEMLNDLMTEWDADGIPLGYTLISDLGDTVTVPDSALRGIKYNLALALAPQYRDNVPPVLVELASRTKSTIIKQVVNVPRAPMPDTLPIGSGNECYTDQRFFPETPDNGLLTETNGGILLEDSTGV